jgi:hypothetical protein
LPAVEERLKPTTPFGKPINGRLRFFVSHISNSRCGAPGVYYRHEKKRIDNGFILVCEE